ARGGGGAAGRPVDRAVDEAHVHAAPEHFLAAAHDPARDEAVVHPVEAVFVLEYTGQAAGGGVDAPRDLGEGEVEVIGDDDSEDGGRAGDDRHPAHVVAGVGRLDPEGRLHELGDLD